MPRLIEKVPNTEANPLLVTIGTDVEISNFSWLGSIGLFTYAMPLPCLFLSTPFSLAMAIAENARQEFFHPRKPTTSAYETDLEELSEGNSITSPMGF